jgi:ribonuclease HI
MGEQLTQTNGKPMKKAKVYTDGGCFPNPGGNGGWGVYVEIENEKFELYGGERGTTNNRMELMAAIEGLRYLEDSHRVTLFTDSMYVKDGITKWIKKWIPNGWVTVTKQPVKNTDLWKILFEEFNRHQTTVVWVKGHSGVHGNEKADSLATKGAKTFI